MSNANEVIALPDSPATPSAIMPALTMSHAQLATLFAEIKAGKERAEQAAIVLADKTSLMKDVIASLLAWSCQDPVETLTQDSPDSTPQKLDKQTTSDTNPFHGIDIFNAAARPFALE
jgi:hypothetical protein